MDIMDTIVKVVSLVAEQFSSSTPSPTEMYFTKHFYETAYQNGLTEQDAIDVYCRGSEIKPHICVREYSGYEIGLYYFIDPSTGQPVITAIWKQNLA